MTDMSEVRLHWMTRNILEHYSRVSYVSRSGGGTMGEGLVSSGWSIHPAARGIHIENRE